jgi:predicted esterase
MPAGGWPLVLYSHGTGGDFRSDIREGIAGALSNVALVGGGTASFATIGYDGVVHGPRREGSTRGEDELFFNAANPPAARDNVLQGAADLFQLVRLAESFSMDAATSPTGEEIRFDPTRIYFMGHSQGGTVGALFVPYEPLVRVAVFSGTGALLLESLQHKTSPTNLPLAMSLLLQEDLEAIRWGNPALHLFQWYFDPADAVNYGRLLVREPAAGMPTHHFMETWGQGDTYSPAETIEAYALTTYAVAVNPLFPDGTGDIGREVPLDPPVTSNFLCPGNPDCTAVLTEYVPPDYDGHFVATRDDRAIRQWTNFFGTAATSGTGVPTLVP